MNCTLVAVVCVLLLADCSCFAALVSRWEWGARWPRGSTGRTMPVSKVIVHHTAGNPCTSSSSCRSIVQSIQRYHMDDRGWDDIGYNFLVGEDGNVYEGRGWDTVGAHAAPHNTNSVGISFIGDFSDRLPSAEALGAARELLASGVRTNKLTFHYSVQGHKDVIATACPGDTLYNHLNLLRQ